MNLTTKGRYAVMAMVDLASCGADKPVSLAAISQRQEIPLAYLEQIFVKLRQSALVTSVRGPGGGYRLAKPPAELPISEIILAAEEGVKMTRCGKHESGCMAAKTRCLTHDLWEGLGEQIEGYLRSVSLLDVCEGRLASRLPAERFHSLH